MGKILQNIVLIGCIISIGYVYSVISDTKPQTVPIPYELKSVNIEESQMASKAQVLLIGDQSSEILKSAFSRIFKNLSDKYQGQLRVYDWTRVNEGIHRTFHKIKSLKKLPPIVLYMGGSSEFHEKIFNAKEASLIKDNFRKYKDPNIKSLVMLSPLFGKLFYNTIETTKLSETPISQHKEINRYAQSNGQLAQQIYEINYLIFSNLFLELVNTIKFNGSSLITINVPTKVTNPPRYTCDNSTSESIIDYQLSLTKALESNQIKKYFPLARNLTKASVGNAKSFYILAKYNDRLGRIKNALFNYRLSHSFDCIQDNSNFIINQIVKRTSLQRGVTFFDFDEIVHQDFGVDFIFLDHYRPQEKYINQIEKQLRSKLSDLLSY
jgi:hypothetical protein